MVLRIQQIELSKKKISNKKDWMMTRGSFFRFWSFGSSILLLITYFCSASHVTYWWILLSCILLLISYFCSTSHACHLCWFLLFLSSIESMKLSGGPGWVILNMLPEVSVLPDCPLIAICGFLLLCDGKQNNWLFVEKVYTKKLGK
jgi:hypothetical protein